MPSFRLLKFFMVFCLICVFSTNSHSNKNTMQSATKFDLIENEVYKIAKVDGLNVSIEWQKDSSGEDIAIIKCNSAKVVVSFLREEIKAAQSKRLLNKTKIKIKKSLFELIEKKSAAFYDDETGNKGPFHDDGIGDKGPGSKY